MGRDRLAPGEWGKIETSIRHGKPVAKVRIRDLDGRLRPVEASGRSVDEARRRLRAKLVNRIAPDTSSNLKSSDTVRDLARYWLEEKSQTVEEQTYNGYRDIWTRLCEPSLGELLIREVTTGKIETLIRRIAAKTPSNARMVKIVCSGVFSTAVRLDLMSHNPTTDARLPRKRRQDVRALSLHELAEVGALVSDYCRGTVIGANGSAETRLGPKPGRDLEDIMGLLIGTGARIAEVLALRWSDVRLDLEPPVVVIQGTLVVPRYKGERLRRQEYRKGDAPPLTLVLPDFAAEILRRRWQGPIIDNEHDAVFVTLTGNWLSPSNIRRSWRAARGEKYAWVTPHTFRKTIATLVKEQYGVETAQTQLGHSNSRVTEAHYIQRMNSAPDLTLLLNTLGPRQVNTLTPEIGQNVD